MDIEQFFNEILKIDNKIRFAGIYDGELQVTGRTDFLSYS
jgi:hypothetical protein